MRGRTISIRHTIFPRAGLSASPAFFLTLAAALLVGGAEVAAAVLLAASMHELGHLLALRLLGASVEGLRLGGFGAEIRARTHRLSYFRELLAVLAGPAVNLLAAPLIASYAVRHGWDWGCLFAGAHVVLGVYNLLPIPPLDGARALYLVTAYCFDPYAADRAVAAVGLVCSCVLCAFGAYLAVCWGGMLFLLASFGLFLPQLGLAKQRATV
ncbi:MAG: hypothetical protein E7425_09780 [Ruminococcaceae bacterium]|nr:hypothetical protein [Oscillospiraceae bacterium]